MGGILGIFIGISAISIAEIFYLLLLILAILCGRRSLEDINEVPQDNSGGKKANVDDMVLEDMEVPEYINKTAEDQ